MRRVSQALAALLLLIPLVAVLGVAPVAANHLQLNASASTTAALNLRAGASTGDRVLRVIPDGERVYVVDGPQNGHWYEITYDGTKGYAFGDYLVQDQIYLSLDPDEGPPGTEVTIYGSGAEPGERIDVLYANWAAGTACAPVDDAQLVSSLTADSAGRFRATHVASRVGSNQAGVMYTANDPGESTKVSTRCFAFTERQSRFFPETGFAVSGAFLDFWSAHGGLAQFGYPLTSAFYEESLTDGGVYRVQYFERQRFELHPENAGTPYEVLIGLMGIEALPAEGFPPPRANPIDRAGCVYFAATGHNVCDRFLDYWWANGGLEIYGYPVAEPFEAELGDGQLHTIQYFERARFEYHPLNRLPYDVLLGQLGREVLDARYGNTLPPPAR